MLNEKPLVAFILITLFVTGCNSKYSKLTILNDYYPTGELKSKHYINWDGVIVDTAFYYFKNGKDSLVEVRNDSGILNGEYVFYYSNGNIFQKGTNVGGQKNGISFRYYEDGRIKSINHYINNKVIGDVFSIFHNGRIEFYTFYDFHERARSYKSWDSAGQLKTDIGKIIYADSVMIDRVNKFYKIVILISNPPMIRTKVMVDCLGQNNESIKSDTIVGERFYSSEGALDGKIIKIRLHGIQYDSLDNSVYRDSSFRLLK